ncbi:hypothetical protein MKX01_014357, partial [Papaver californicum]
CWTLLEKMVFVPGGIKKTPKLIEIGKKIAAKCGGVPLATKILGGLMHSKCHENDWLAILDNEIWEHVKGEEQVIRVLKLSYDHLAPHLKQCFAYCSLIPKGVVISRKRLIQLWMAEGFLSSSSRPDTEMETLGNEYFNSLLENSFFQDEQIHELGDVKSCKMHHLVHDLAQSVARNECLIKDVNKPLQEGNCGIRRIVLFDENEVSSFPKVSSKVKQLRTFICTTPKLIDNTYAMQIFMNFSNVRVLSLSYSAINKLPPSIAKLKHLRYLNLSNSSISKLPNSFITLYSLQTLILKNCFELKELPRGMRKLTNLRNLIICKTGNGEWIPPMPCKVRTLSSLHYLPVFIVGNKNNGYGIEELRDLNLLGGKLQIRNLENVTDRKDAEGGELKCKQHILRLELHWTDNKSFSAVSRDESQVLEGLQPHQNLKRLGIYNYAGSKFPTWMMSRDNLLHNLVFLTLENCSKCESLPPLGLLPFLKVLIIQGLDAVRSIGSEFYGSNSSNVKCFPSLEDLSVFRMVSLVEWSHHVLSITSSFPLVRQLKVKVCRKLMIMPTRFPSLKVLELEDCNGEIASSLLEFNVKSLAYVKIDSCKELIFLPRELLTGNELLQNFQVYNCEKLQGINPYQDARDEEEEEEQIQLLPSISLNTLIFYNCPALFSWPDLRGFISLRMLFIYGCKSQQCIPSGIGYLPKLERLVMGGFSKKMDLFPFPTAEEGTSKSHYFASLRNLEIYGWPKLRCLPDQVQYLTSLQTLWILGFESLVAMPGWLGNLISLRELKIHWSGNLKYMPSREQMLRLTSLQHLHLVDCHLLVDRCKEGGEEYSKTSHIPKFTYNKEGLAEEVEELKIQGSL